MKFDVKVNNKDHNAQWIVTIEGEEWQNILKKAENKLKSKIEIPGFRKGKVPEQILRKHVNEGRILGEAHDVAFKDAYNFAITQESKVTPFSDPTPSILELTMEKYIVQFEFDLKPEIDIKKYKDFKTVKKEQVKVTSEEIERELKLVRDRFALYQLKDGPIEKGDAAFFDYEGFIDNVGFPGGKGEDFELEIGSNQFIPGFEDAMIGLKAGTKTEINVKFPDDYHEESLQGKPALFKINLKEVKLKQLPELNDELTKDLNIENVNTIGELKTYIENELKKVKENQEKERFIEEVLREIAKDAKIVLPKSVIEKERKKLFEEFQTTLKSRGLNLDQYKKLTSLTDEKINEELLDDAKSRIENSLIFEVIRKNEKFDITEEEIDKEYEKLAAKFNIDVELLKNGKMVPKERITEQLESQKLVQFLFDNNG